MSLKKVKTTKTLKGRNLKEVIENYTKISHDDTSNYICTDICEGTSADYGNFIILIDDVNGKFGYVPSADFDNVTDQIADGDFTEPIANGGFEFSFEMKKSKKNNNRTYCVVNY